MRLMSEENRVKFWDWDNTREVLNFYEVGDAIADFLERKAEVFEGDQDDFIADLPQAVRIYGYTRMSPPFLDAEGLVTDTLDFLDEEVGDPSDHTEPTKRMLDAAKAFYETILSEYEVWMHEPTTHQDVDIRAWIEEFGLPFTWD